MAKVTIVLRKRTAPHGLYTHTRTNCKRNAPGDPTSDLECTQFVVLAILVVVDHLHDRLGCCGLFSSRSNGLAPERAPLA